MTNDTTRTFDRFVHMFRLMIYAGIIFILLGVGISFAFVGAARSFVMSGSIGAGGLIIFGGIRGSLRGKAMLDQMNNEHPKHPK